jgi:hypothetical protein
MMAETAFLSAIADFLSAEAALAAATVGVAEPAANTDLPAVVLSLEEARRLGGGLGERSALITDGALHWTATIDLANPVLPEEPSFVLLSADRLQLILPHGGLRQADGGEGPLGPADLSVTVAGAPRTVVNAAPGPNEVRADPLIGLLTFGAALPPTGDVVANYVLGQWERRVTNIAGTLRLDARAAAASAVADLSVAAVDALLAAPRSGIGGLIKIALSDLSSVGAPDATLASSRGRSARFSFEYEHEVNRPDSSGGVIQRVPITSRLNVVTVDPSNGTLVTGVVTESD